MRVVLDRREMEQLFRQDESQRDGGGWQRKIVGFQERLNKTTGELVLSDEDVVWIKRHGSHPEKGSWQKWISAAFERHIDLTVPA